MSNEDFQNMTHQHFYENYFLINGKKPPPLTSIQKEVFAAFDKLKADKVCFVPGRLRGRTILYTRVKEKANKAKDNN